MLSMVSVMLGQTQTFTATLCIAEGTPIQWSVNGTIGGNSNNGTIAATGSETAQYVAPLRLPSNRKKKPPVKGRRHINRDLSVKPARTRQFRATTNFRARYREYRVRNWAADACVQKQAVPLNFY
jgi:hypothetical protein